MNENYGMRGMPELWLDKVFKVTGSPWYSRAGIESGKYLLTGSSSFTFPFSTASASNVAVNVFEIDPISKMLCSLGSWLFPLAVSPYP
jgi:hypothetical protein